MTLAYPNVIPAPFYLFLREPLALGAEGKAIFIDERKAYRHLSEPASSQLMTNDDLAYRSLPFQTVFTRRVRYRLMGRLRALPYLE